MTKDNNPTVGQPIKPLPMPPRIPSYHFGTDIPIPTMEEVYDAQSEAYNEENGGALITISIGSACITLIGIAVILFALLGG